MMYANDRPSCFSFLWQIPSSRKSTSPTSVSFILLVYSPNRDVELHICWPLYHLNKQSRFTKHLRLRRPSTDILFEGYRSALGTQKVRPLLIERRRHMFTDTKSMFHSCRKPFPRQTAVIQVDVYERSSLENTIYKRLNPNFWRGAKKKRTQRYYKEARKDTGLVSSFHVMMTPFWMFRRNRKTLPEYLRCAFKYKYINGKYKMYPLL